MIPVDNFNIYDCELNRIENKLKMLNPIGSITGFNNQYNYDGYINYSSTNDSVFSYTQLFRNNSIETVDSMFHSGKQINGKDIEKKIEISIKTNIEFYKKINVLPPYIVFISLLNFKGIELISNNQSLQVFKRISKIEFGDFGGIYENNIILPDILINDMDLLSNKLKHIYNIIWNSNGYKESPAT